MKDIFGKISYKKKILFNLRKNGNKINNETTNNFDPDIYI